MVCVPVSIPGLPLCNGVAVTVDGEGDVDDDDDEASEDNESR